MMGRGPCTFRQRDVTRAVKALTAAGIEVARIDIKRDGQISIVPKNIGGQDEQARPAEQEEVNDWDSIL